MICKLFFEVVDFYKYMLLDAFYLIFIWVMHELRQLKNSKTVFTQRSGKTRAPAHLVSSASLWHPCQWSASQRETSIWNVQARQKAVTTKQEMENFFPETLMTLNNLWPAIWYHHMPSDLKVRGKVAIAFECILTLILSYNIFVRYLHFAIRLQTHRFFTVFLLVLAEGFWPFPSSKHCLATVSDNYFTSLLKIIY